MTTSEEFVKRVNETIEAMTPEEFTEWRSDYYAGLMVCPFGYDLDTSGHGTYPCVPYGMSKHGVPKLRPEDE